MIRSLKSFDLKNKKILIRVDFNVPLSGESVVDNFRIKSSLPTIIHCLESGASVILMSHLGRPKGKKIKEMSLVPVGKELASLLQMPIKFSEDCISQDALDVSLGLKPGEIHLLENLRFYKEEEANDDEFSSRLAKHGQIFINDAFGTSHRVHSSNVGVIRHFKNFGIGSLIDKELNFLEKIIKKPKPPFNVILGGAKIGSKIKLIKNFLDKADNILIGGGMAFTFLKAKKYNVGLSLVDDSMIPIATEILKLASNKKVNIEFPIDLVCSKSIEDGSVHGSYDLSDIPGNLIGLDIGPKTIDRFKNVLSDSNTILWNGPLGLFENKNFESGTLEIAMYLSKIKINNKIIIIGGGDTAAAVSKFNLNKEMTHVSTGGGSSMELMSGNKLIAIESMEV